MPEVTGKESGNYAPAAENLDLPILSPSFNSNVWFGVFAFFFKTILTFHITAKNCKERTAAAQSRETKKRRQKRG